MMHNFNHYMEKISLLDGTRCVLPPDEVDLEVGSQVRFDTSDFGTDVIVDPVDPSFSAIPAKGWEYTYVDENYEDKNADLLIDCVPNLFEIGKIWGEVFSGLTGSSLHEALIID